MAKVERVRSLSPLLALATMTSGCFPLGDNEEPQAATSAQVKAALTNCRVPQQYLVSHQGEITVKFPDRAPNVEFQRRCVDAYLQKEGVSVGIAWHEGNAT